MKNNDRITRMVTALKANFPFVNEDIIQATVEVFNEINEENKEKHNDN